MSGWGDVVDSFQKGANFSQDFRARSQIEKARDFALERTGMENFDLRESGKATAASIKDQFGIDTPLFQHEGLPDPFAFKMIDWFKSKMGKKKSKAIDTGEITPTDSVAAVAPASEDAESDDDMGSGPRYADGGDVNYSSERQRRRYNEHKPTTKDYRKRFGMETDNPTMFGDAAATALGAGSDLLNEVGNGVPEIPVIGPEKNWVARNFYPDVQERMQGDGRRVAGTAAAHQRTAIPPAAIAAAGPTAPAEQMGPPRTAIPAPAAAPARREAVGPPGPQRIDFSKLEIDPREVPDMKTDDWKKYRVAALQSAARKGMDPASANAKVNEMITGMQQQGFLSYGQQGLALQQAGNIKGAMAAYRAAYQYFPNGHDVEFGVHNGQIVGVGRDEKTGDIVKDTAMVMDPERVSALLENFKNPQAFRMWTKDWRDFQQKKREYTEVTKPVAQAQINALGNNSEANLLRAENAGLRAGGAGSAAGMRIAENVFRERVGMLGIQDEAQADFLASVMSRVKQANPNTPDNTIMQGVMSAHRDGSLQQRLNSMGMQ